ncbi:MAG: VWA domain-containing protein, partial [Candidatus Dadabacteria bacterium]
MVLLFVVPALTWLVLRIHTAKREEILSSFAGISGNIHKNLYNRYVIILITILICLAVLRPYNGFKEIKSRSYGRDIMVVIDISASMYTKDVYPSRITVAKRKLEDIISHLSDSGSTDRVGIILFAGAAYLYCPLTSDYGALRQFADFISPELTSIQGTNIFDAIRIAAESFDRTTSIDSVLIVMTDGEDRSLAPSDVGPITAKLGMKISIIGIGTPEGGPIELPNGRFMHDRKGSLVISRLNEDGLIKLAKTVGGTYIRATLDDSDIMSALRKNPLLDKEKATVERKITIYNEYGPYLLWCALLLMCIGTARIKKFLYLALVFAYLIFSFIFISSKAIAEEIPSLHDSYLAYKEGRYQEALKGFEEAYKENPKNLDIMQALGSTYYKLK